MKILHTNYFAFWIAKKTSQKHVKREPSIENCWNRVTNSWLISCHMGLGASWFVYQYNEGGFGKSLCIILYFDKNHCQSHIHYKHSKRKAYTLVNWMDEISRFWKIEQSAHIKFILPIQWVYINPINFISSFLCYFEFL